MLHQIRMIRYRDHLLHAECHSGGVASVVPPDVARVSNATWRVTIDGSTIPGERAGTPDDNDEEIVQWAKECADAYLSRA